MKDGIGFVASSSRALRIPMVQSAAAMNRSDANEGSGRVFGWQYRTGGTGHPSYPTSRSSPIHPVESTHSSQPFSAGSTALTWATFTPLTHHPAHHPLPIEPPVE